MVFLPNITTNHAITCTNPETKFHWHRIQNPVAGIWSPQRGIQNPIMFPGFPYMGLQWRSKVLGPFQWYYWNWRTLPSRPNQSWILSKMRGNECYFGHNIAGEVGGTTGWTQSQTKIVVRSGVLCNNYLEGLFHTVQSSFVLHSRCRTECFVG